MVLQPQLLAKSLCVDLLTFLEVKLPDLVKLTDWTDLLTSLSHKEFVSCVGMLMGAATE